MFKNIHQKAKPGIYLLVQESGSGKSERLSSFLKEIGKDKYLLISHDDMENKYRFNDISQIVHQIIKKNLHLKTIFIDGIFDKYTSHEFISQLELLIKFANKQIFILSNNTELLSAYSIFAKNLNLDHGHKNILLNQIELSWKELYVSTYWKAFNQYNGNIKIGGKKSCLNEADFTALLLASRYWGLANFIFKIQINTNDYYYKALSRSFFHDQQLDLDTDKFLANINIPSYLNLNKIKSYISVNGKLKYAKANMLQVIKDMKTLQQLNFDLFVHSLIGRQILQKNASLIPCNKIGKWRSTISGLVHAADYVINALIAKDRVQSFVVINALEKLDENN